MHDQLKLSDHEKDQIKEVINLLAKNQPELVKQISQNFLTLAFENRFTLHPRRLKELGSEGVSLQRYKGLGEMNPKQLWETTMDPKTRMLKKVTIEDAVSADEIFEILMGDEVEPRREFIQDHAKEVSELDI